MEWRDQVLAEVGQGMGISGLDFSGTGVVSFEFERSGTLYMELQDEGILMYLIRELTQFEKLPVFEKALKMCHYKQNLRFPLQIGLQGENQLFLSLFLANEDFNRPNIESAMQYLSEQFDAIGS